MCVSTFKDILKFKFGVFLLRDDKKFYTLNIIYPRITFQKRSFV